MAQLNDKQKLFCKEYLVDLNATQAAIRAGYSAKTAGSQGFDHLKKPEIQSEIKRLMDKRSKRTEITADRVLEELAKIAFANSKDYFNWSEHNVSLIPSDKLTDDQGAVVAEVSQTTTKEGGSIKIKLHDKMAALEKIGKHLGMYSENVNVSGSLDVNKVDDKSEGVLMHFINRYAERATKGKEADNGKDPE